MTATSFHLFCYPESLPDSNWKIYTQFPKVQSVAYYQYEHYIVLDIYCEDIPSCPDIYVPSTVDCISYVQQHYPEYFI